MHASPAHARGDGGASVAEAPRQACLLAPALLSEPRGYARDDSASDHRDEPASLGLGVLLEAHDQKRGRSFPLLLSPEAVSTLLWDAACATLAQAAGEQDEETVACAPSLLLEDEAQGVSSFEEWSAALQAIWSREAGAID